MPPLFSRWSAVQATIFVASALAASRAHAEGAASSVALSYHVDDPTACPRQSSFERRIEQMTPKALFVPESTDPTHAELQISIRGGSSALYTGTASYRSMRGQAATERRISSRSCESVVRALALVAALAIDPDAHPAAADPDDEPPPPPDEPPAKPTPANVEPRPAVAARPSPRHDPPLPRLPWIRTFGVLATLATGRAPEPLLGARVAFDLQRALPRNGAFFRFDVGAQLDFASSRPFDGALARGHFDSTTVGLRTCPLGVRPGLDWVDLGACLGARLGAAFAEGRGFDRPASGVSFWGEGIVSSRLRLGSPRIAAELSLGLAAHAVRPTYYRDVPLQTIYQVPWLGFDGALGVVVHFP